MPASPLLHPTEKYGYAGHGQLPSGGGALSKGRRTGLKSRTFQLLTLRFGWVVIVIWFEVGEFFHSLSSCKFPDLPLKPYTAPDTLPSHLVLIADPHVPHPVLSHPEDAWRWTNTLIQAFDELFMRKSWNVVMRLGRVDAVVVVGDMLDVGRGRMTEDDYESYFSLYSSIFSLPPSIPLYHVPGNHDIPLGPWPQFSPLARDRYAKHFGTPNQVISIANHTIVLLDSVGLVEEDYRRYAGEMQFGEWDGVEGGVIEFVKSIGDEPMNGPRILISHIPLARPEGAKCGPYREHGRIQKGAGPGYQNLLGSETSQFLLEELQPSIVFSGDDHDYCEFTHSGRVREVTLKSFSTSTGIRRPGFQLLSLIPPLHPDAKYSREPTLADRPCFLPDQAGVYTRVYLPLFILTAIYLFGTNIRNAYRRWAGGGYDKVEKYRHSPNLETAGMLGHRRVSDRDREKERERSERPVPLTLPSRKSSQHLSGLSAMTSGQSTGTSTSRGLWRVTSRTNLASPSPDIAAHGYGYGHRSVPPSPFGSPRPSFSMDRYDNDDVSTLPSPNMSRRSSFIYMNDPERGEGGQHLSAEPNNYFAGTSSSGPGSGLNLHVNTSTAGMTSQPNSPLYRRTSHTNLQAPTPQRRVTMPRLPSFVNGLPSYGGGDGVGSGSMTPGPYPHSSGMGRRGTAPGSGIGYGQAPVSVLSLEHAHLSGDGLLARTRRGIESVRVVIRWMWRTRESVLGRSAREVWAVFWVAGVVWVGVNALFFWG